MRQLKMIFAELFGLFVDDGAFAVAILVWLGFVWILAPRVDLSAAAKGAGLFLGLVVILVESAARQARK